jgi:hypothetical protein
MSNYNPIIYLRLHGWGVVSNADATISSVQAADNSAGTANIDIVGLTTTQSITTDEIGAEIYIEGMTGLEDGFYTLTNVASAGGNTRVSIAGDPSKFSLSAGANSGNMRVEDHYKICNRIPDFVTGTNARSRWLVNLVDITPTLSSEVNVRGGVAKIDGLTITHNYIFAGLDKVRFNILNQDDNIRTQIRIYSDPDQTTNIQVERGIPYMASYNNPDTAPTLGLYEPTWWGSECIRVDSATGSDPYLLTMTRGLLRTDRGVHPYGQLFFDGMTTPFGKTAEVLLGVDGTSIYDDFNKILIGPVTDIGYDDGVIAQTLEISSDLMKAIRKSAGDLATPVKFRETNAEIEYFSQFGKTWDWVKIGKACFRIASDNQNESTMPNYDGPLRLRSNPFESDGRSDNGRFGLIRYIASIIDDRFVEIDGNGTINGVMVERAGAKEFANYQFPIRPWSYALDRYPGNDSESRENRVDLINELFENRYLVYSSTTEEERPKFNFDALIKDNPEGSMAHVFEPQYFGPDNTYQWSRNLEASTKILGCNPIDLLLQMLLTDLGNGSNTFVFEGSTYDFDVLPAELGLGFKAEDLNIQSFMEAAEQFSTNNIYVCNAFIEAEDAGELSKWIEDNILKTYFLCLVTDNNGKLQLTQLADSARKAGMIELTDDDLFGFGNNTPVTFNRDAGALISRITYQFDRPYLIGSNPQSKDTVNFRYAFDGLMDHYRPLGADDITIKPKFSPFFSATETEAFESYLGRYLGNYRSPFPVIEVYVDQDFQTDAFSVGKYQIVNLSRLPNATGTLDSNLFGVGLVVKRQKDLLNGVDKMTIAVVETLSTDERIRYASSAEVDTGSTGTVIQLVDSVYIPTFVSDYTSDAESFQVGDALLLYDENFVLRSTATTPVVSAINSATEIEIDTEFEDGGGVIVPAAGDIITLAEKVDQTVSATINGFAYVFTARADSSFWEN